MQAPSSPHERIATAQTHTPFCLEVLDPSDIAPRGMVEAGVQAELESLRARLAQSELDKAALQSDVEMLCLQTTSNTTFNSSSVLQERIRYTGAQRF